VKLEVLQAKVGLDGEEFAGGVHEIAKPTKKLLRAAAMQEKVGAVKVTASKEERGTMVAAVESQADSEKAYAKAQEDGRWQIANYRQAIADRRDRLAAADLADDASADLTDDERKRLRLTSVQRSQLDYDISRAADRLAELGETI
jgi:hypothetical protein